MSDNYLIIHKSVLPDYYEKVLKARRLLESGRVREVSEAVRTVRSCRPLTGDWKRNIDADYKARKKIT